MNPTIFKVLQALNQLDIHGERNHELVLYCIQKLKPLQSMPYTPAEDQTDGEVK